MRLQTLIVLAAMLAAAQPAEAQNKKRKPAVVEAPKAEEVAPAPAPEPVLLPPAYEKEMLRLSEVLGALHYLRALCNANEGSLWRDEMEALLVAEDPTPARRQLLVGSFNRGYRGFSEVYRECTPPAAEAANRYLKQGVRLAAEIPGRFGN